MTSPKQELRFNSNPIINLSFIVTCHTLVTDLAPESGDGAMDTDLDLATMASLCLALLEAVLPNNPGLGDLLLVLKIKYSCEFHSQFMTADKEKEIKIKKEKR